MKLTKARFNKNLLSSKQTKRKLKPNVKQITHVHTYKKRKPFNLKNHTIKACFFHQLLHKNYGFEINLYD